MLENHFPILKRKVNGHKLVYLDNASTTHKPETVISTIGEFYRKHNANIHRGIHTLSREATNLYESTRDKVRKFINAKSREEIIFTSGATEAINLVVWAWGHENLQSGDEILLTEMEHHSNLVPWQILAKKKRANLKFIPVIATSPSIPPHRLGREEKNEPYTQEMGRVGERSKNDGKLDLSKLNKLITKRTRIVALTHISNVLGAINPVSEIIKAAHAKGTKVLVDGAQAGAHLAIDVQKLDCDFYVLSGHKMYGPTGIGILYGKKELLENMPPYQTGGHMIKTVELDPGSSPGRPRKLRVAWAELPHKFEAGTANIAEVVGLAAAVDLINTIGIDRIKNYESRITKYALGQMRKITGLEIYGSRDTENRIGVISFNVLGIPPHDLASILDSRGIAIRTGHHCAMPLHQKLGIESSARISLAIYNTKEDIDRLIEGIGFTQRLLSSRT